MRPIDEKLLFGLLTRPQYGGHNQIISDCLFCGKEKHFYVNIGINAKGIVHPYDCKRCGVSGGVYTLFAKLNVLHLLQGHEINHEKLNKFDFVESVEGEEDFEEYELENKKLSSGFKDLTFEDEAYQYLLTRKFSEIDFELYTPKQHKFNKKLKEYVTIPVYQDFQIKGWVNRYIGEDDEATRYLNSKFTDFGHILGGFDEIHKDTNTLILVEGFFDKVSVTTELGLHYINELKCCNTWGKKISPYQIWLILNKTNVKNIILMYDASDAVNDMKKIGFQLNNYFYTQIADTGHTKDPGNLSQKEFEIILQNLRTPDEFWYNKIQKKKF